MFGSPPNPVIAGLESAVVAIVFLTFGYLLVDALVGKKIKAVDAWGLALAAFFAYVLGLMLAHVVTGGRVFSSPWLVRGVTLLTLLAVGVRKVLLGRGAPALRTRGRRDLAALGVLLASGLLLWASPLFRLLPLDHTGDMNMHMGWAGQLLNGEATPSAPITGDIPNYYPWMFHALIAFLALFTPGGEAFHAQGPLQLLQIGGAVLSLYALGAHLAGRWAGAAAALFGALSGGVGYFLVSRPSIVMNAWGHDGNDALRYAGDLVWNRPFNLSFYNLVPPFPRDVPFALLPAFLLLVALALARRSRLTLAASGAVLGLVGLTHSDAFLVGVAIALLIALLGGVLGRARLGALLLVPALGLFAIWFVPLALNYLRLGGFKNMAAGEIDVTPLGLLGAWGVAVPFALYGAWVWLPKFRREPEARMLLAVVGAPVGMLLAGTFIPRVLGEGFTTLGYKHRYVPLVYLAVALFAALGAADLLARARRVHAALAGGLVAATVALAAPSPLIASLALPDVQEARPRLRSLLTSSLQGEDTVLNLASRGARRCIAAAPPELSFRLFSYTGYRLVLYAIGEKISPNVRWNEIPDDPGKRRRFEDNRMLTEGLGSPSAWETTAKKYGVDVVVASAEHAGAPPFNSYRKETVHDADGGRWVVMQVGSCDRPQWPESK